MSTSWWPADWILNTTGWALAFIGTALLIWSLFWDQARRRKRCPKCWYDMSGVVGVSRSPDSSEPLADLPPPWTCPECGRVIVRPNQLRKTRRRWPVALAALLVVAIGAGAPLGSLVYRNGWWSLVPTWALIDIYPVSGETGAFGAELIRRTGVVVTTSGGFTWAPCRLSAGEQLYLLRRIRYGNIFASVSSPRWKDTYGRLPNDLKFLFNLPMPSGSSLMGGSPKLVAPALERLYDLPLDLTLSVRDPSPVDAPLFVAVRVQSPWPWPTGWRISVKRTDTDELVYEGLDEGFIVRNPPMSGPLKLRVSIYQYRQAEPNPDWNLVEQRNVDLPFRVTGTIADQLKPLSDPKLDALVRKIVYEVSDGGAMTDVRSTSVAETEGVAFGVIMEHQLNGKTMCRERMWWSGGSRMPYQDFGTRREWIISGAGICAWSANPGENWSIRIVSDPETALRVPDAKSYWTGDQTIKVINDKTRPGRPASPSPPPAQSNSP